MDKAVTAIKKHRNLLIGAVIGIVLVLLIITVTSRFSSPASMDAFLSGVWQGDENFCKESDLSGMILTLRRESRGQFTGTFTTYGDEGLFENSDIDVKFGRWRKDGTLYTTTANIEGSPVLPTTLTADISLETGYMILYDGEDLYAEMYKDNQASAL